MTSIFALLTGALTLLGGPVTRLTISPAAERTQVLISVDGDVDEVSHFTMEGPNRLVVDLVGTQHRLPSEDFLELNRGGIRGVRTSQLSSDVVRVVLDLDRQVPYEVLLADGGVAISLENPAGTFPAWSTAALEEEAPLDAALPAPPSDDPQQAVVTPECSGERISIQFNDTPVQDVLLAFSQFSGRSVVAGAGIQGLVTADIVNERWDCALDAILNTNGLVAEEKRDTRIIEVHDMQNLNNRQATEPLITRAYKINYATADEIQSAIESVQQAGRGGGGGGGGGGGVSRGQSQVNPSTNTVIVTDTDRVHQQIQILIQQLDVPTPQVTIQAKIVFVSRTALDEFGVSYDLKDSAGNQLNVLAPGAVDSDGDGVIELPEEQVEVGTNVVSLGGNSVAALGNANARVAGPTLTLLTSLLVGRHTLVGFIEALQSVNLSDVQASPLVRVMDNQQAEIRVGEDTPLRVIDSGSGAAGGAAGLPTASVDIQETGIRLLATPHVTAGDRILLDLEAERSAPQLAESDAGFIFTTQNARTRVLVQDGQTVVIGGLTINESNEVRSGIPLLMDLPLLGGLFRVTRESNTQRDLIILVTPHIVRETLN